MTKLNGQCFCENVQIEIETFVPEKTFAPRKCDCDFCLTNGICYFSDAKGKLNFEIKDRRKISYVRQGSETAEFLKCLNCEKILAATYREENQVFASVNANLINTDNFFVDPLPVSPKNLSKEQKIQRWKELWFQNAKIKEI